MTTTSPTSSSRSSRSALRARASIPVVALMVGALTLGAPVAAHADDDPLGGVGDTVHKTTGTVGKTLKKTTGTVGRTAKKATTAASSGSSSRAKSSSGSSRRAVGSVGRTVQKVAGSASSARSSSSSPARAAAPRTSTSRSTTAAPRAEAAASPRRATARTPAGTSAALLPADPTTVVTDLVDAITTADLGAVVDAVLGDVLDPLPAATPAGPPAAGPDYAYADLANLNQGGMDLVGLGRTRTTGTRDDTRADSTLLSVLGRELVGAHADSRGQTEDSGTPLADPACAMTNGLACADLLYADAAASRTATTRDSSARSGVADTCLLGSDPTGTTCSGIAIGAGQDSSTLHSDSTTGTSTASSDSSLADVCLTSTTAGCLLSADAVSSSTSSDNKGHASADSTVADVALGGVGTPLGVLNDPVTLSVPAGPAALLTVMLNQNATTIGQGTGSASSTPVGLSAVGGAFAGDVGSTGTFVSDANVIRPPATDNPPAAGNPTLETPTADRADRADRANQADQAGSGARAGLDDKGSASRAGGVLPHTGGPALWTLLLGGLLVALGAAAVRTRRRVHGIW